MSLFVQLAAYRGDMAQKLLAELPLDDACLRYHWPFWARETQLPPPGDWRLWLMMAGRGFGKTRAGAEWVRETVRRNPGCRIALIGATMAEARAIMVEGTSGLATICAPWEKLYWAPSLNRLRWGNGAQAKLFSAAEPEALRGPEHDFAWADEVAKWPHGNMAWDNLMLTMRRGKHPRIMATTTPRPVPLIRRLLAQKGVAISGGQTRDNAANLSPDFVAVMQDLYGGTRLGRQELDGELIEDVAGALWNRAMIERCRVRVLPEIMRVVIGVDPPASAGGDACGIIAVALGRDDRAYVIEDASISGASPETWARAVAQCAARHGADRVIAEANMGGDMVASVLRAAEAGLPVKLVHASRGKSARAEPVAALYEAGRVAHFGGFAALEDELCGLIAGGGYQGPGRSPDRADALVWALHALMLGGRSEARIRGV